MTLKQIDHWPIFVLSLEGDEARRAPLLNALAEMGLKAEVLIGVDGRNGLPEWAEAEVDRTQDWTTHSPGLPMTDGEFACALSHVRAYQKIITEGLPGAIVFEDDAIIGEPFKRFVTARGYTAGEMVVLGHKETWVRRFSKTHLCEGVVGHRLVAPTVFAHGYSLSHTAAAHILKRATPVRARADWPCDISRLKSLATDPQIAVQPANRESQSHMQAGRVAARHKKLRDKRATRYISSSYWIRILRKRFDPHNLRKHLAQRID